MCPPDLDLVFSALAHPSRRRILDILAERPGVNVGEIAVHFECSRIAVMKHLRSLEEAGLCIASRQGREKRHYLNAVPLQQICDRWTDQYTSFWSTKLVDIKERVESAARPAKEKKRA